MQTSKTKVLQLPAAGGQNFGCKDKEQPKESRKLNSKHLYPKKTKNEQKAQDF